MVIWKKNKEFALTDGEKRITIRSRKGEKLICIKETDNMFFGFHFFHKTAGSF